MGMSYNYRIRFLTFVVPHLIFSALMYVQQFI